MNKRVLTIQDISCVGQCSLTVALPLISACGIEACVLPSSVLSTHTGGFKGFTFRDLTQDMPAIENHWISENIKFDAFYTGYVSEGQIEYILSIMDSCAKEGALRIVDPAMADNGKLYVGFNEDFPSKMAKLCKGADYILPNMTEAALLMGLECKLEGYDEAYVEMLVKGLSALGAKNVILTGVSFSKEKLGVAVYEGGKLSYYFNDTIAQMSHGTGDVYASAFTGALLKGKNAMEAAKIAADFVCDCIYATPKEHWYGVCFESVISRLTEAVNK